MKTRGTFVAIVFAIGIGLVSAHEAKAALGAPTGLSVTAGIDTLSITWNAVSGATSYKIYATTDCSGPAKTSATNSLSYGTKGNTAYQFTVKASDKTGLGACSSATAALSSTQLAAPTGLSVTRAVNAFTITWNAVSNASTYQLFLTGGNCAEKGKSTATTSYTMTGKLASEYNFAVRAVTAKKNLGVCSSGTGARYVLPAAPTLSSVTIGRDGTTRTVKWSKVAGATYTVYRSTTASNSGFQSIASGLSANSYMETSPRCSLAEGILNCWYKVVASAHGDNSADSNVLLSSHIGPVVSLTANNRCSKRDFVGRWGVFAADTKGDGEINFTVPAGKTLKTVRVYDGADNRLFWYSDSNVAFPVGIVVNNSRINNSYAPLSVAAGTAVTLAFTLANHLGACYYSCSMVGRGYQVVFTWSDNTTSVSEAGWAGNGCS